MEHSKIVMNEQKKKRSWYYPVGNNYIMLRKIHSITLPYFLHLTELSFEKFLKGRGKLHFHCSVPEQLFRLDQKALAMKVRFI